MDADRRTAIVRLLQTRNQHLPEPRRRDETAAGFVHTTTYRESCPDCLTNDRVSKLCETCGGRGYLEHRRQRDPYATDRVLPYGFTADKHEHARQRDAEIARLEQQTRPPWSTREDELADANQHPYGWELARRRMYASHDYRALDRSMDALAIVDPQACSLLRRVYEYEILEPPDPNTLMGAVLERGLQFVDKWMPDPIRAPGVEPAVRVGRGPVRAEAGVQVKQTRDQAMREAAAAGATVRELMARFGVSRSTVYAIVNAEAAA